MIDVLSFIGSIIWHICGVIFSAIILFVLICVLIALIKTIRDVKTQKEEQKK